MSTSEPKLKFPRGGGFKANPPPGRVWTFATTPKNNTDTVPMYFLFSLSGLQEKLFTDTRP